MEQHHHHHQHHDVQDQGPRRRAVALAPLVAGAIAASAWAALPTSAWAASDELTCGTVVTTDVRLRADLVACPGPGLVVGAPDITIDLGGHTLGGSGAGVGIENPGEHDGITIRRGTVRDFTIGIDLLATDGGRVDRVTITDNSVGIVVQRSAGVELDRITATDNSFSGIEVNFSEDTTVRRSTVSGSGHGGIIDRASFASHYERNDVTGNGFFGMEITQTECAHLARNDVSGNAGDGIRLGFWATGVTLERNATNDNGGAGLVIEEAGNAVRRHASAGNGSEDVVAPA
jgi:nitrous oxidase accessory protein NosD